MTATKRFRYDRGPCLHCERPEEDHPAEADPPRSDPNGPWEKRACKDYTATGRIVEVE